MVEKNYNSIISSTSTINPHKESIDIALVEGKEINFESKHWRSIHTFLLEKAIGQGGDES